MTHYDVLGADRTATASELREAFRRAARNAHPDRHGEQSAQQMAAVNEAWRVLGDVERRRRYDADLDAVEHARRAEPSSGQRVTAAPSAAPSAPTPAAEFEPARFPWRFMAGLLSIGVAVIVLGVIVYEPPPPAGPDGILRPGDCVTLSAILEAVEVTCGQHDAVVERLIPVDQTCPADTQPYRDQQGMGTACVVRA